MVHGTEGAASSSQDQVPHSPWPRHWAAREPARPAVYGVVQTQHADAVVQTQHVTKNLPRQDPQPHPQHDQRAEPRELALLAPPSSNRAHDALAIIDMGRRGGEEALR